MSTYRVAIDIGGTFTDFVLQDAASGETRTGKILSTPSDPAEAVLAGLGTFVPSGSEISFLVHGTTVGLNAVVERRGARLAIVTTEGFGDVYTIAGNDRRDIFDFRYRKPVPLVPPDRVVEVRERLAADGSVVVPLDPASIDAVVEFARRERIEAIAVCLLFSYLDPRHEVALAQQLSERLPDVTVTASHQVSRQWREYARTSTAALNAYVAPVVTRYLTTLIDRLEKHSPAPLFVMQSNGGLTVARAARDTPVQTLLSGPVGGAIGAQQLSRMLGRDNLVSIDMGGTSFDVSLIVDGSATIVDEATIEGLPVQMPIVEINGIGAGGGSIGWTEAGAMRVGPRSAGADPGPACYGRGGTEPTVTDANLLLGRIDERRFAGGGMPLDIEAASKAAARLGEQLGLDVRATAQGIVDIVNAKMADAIRTATVRRGIDPREFSLVAFGGAGPMHAVELAEQLEISEVVIPVSPGTFSASGMLETDIRHDVRRTFYASLAQVDRDTLEAAFLEVQEEGSTLLRDEGVESHDMSFERVADLRYQGQEYSLTLSLGPPGPIDLLQLRRRFDQLYLDRYGHSSPEAPVEIVRLGVAATGTVPRPAPCEPPCEPRGDWPLRGVVFKGAVIDTAIVPREQLAPSETYPGPMIITEATATAVVPPGWSVCRMPGGHLSIRRTGAATKQVANARGKPNRADAGRAEAVQVDPVTTEVVRNFMTSCAEDMNAALFRSAYTPVIYEGRDCAVALLDSDGEPLGMSTGVPIFLGNLEVCVKLTIEQFGLDWFGPGDVVAMNDPYLQGTHLHDVTVFGPIFHAGRLVGFAATRAHWQDVGGRDPGTTMGSIEVFQEGFRMGPTRVVKGYEPLPEWMDFLRRASRFGYELMGDFSAQVAAIRTGEARVSRMLDRIGVDVFEAAKKRIFEQAEALDRAAISELPDGTYRAEGWLDNDGYGAEPVRVCVAVTIEGDRMVVDLDGSARATRGPINCGYAQTVSAVRLTYKALVNTHLPVTGGTFATLDVRVPDDCVFNAKEPAACEWYFTGLGVLCDLIMTALAPAVGDRVVAPHYGDSMVINLNGIDASRARPLWVVIEPTAGGWGAHPGGDGESALINLTNGSFKNIPVEIYESKFPVRIERFAIRTDSGGPGRWRGGCGVVRAYRLLADGSLSLWFDRSVTPAWGLEGGMPATGPRVRVEGPGGPWEGLKVNCLPLRAGALVTIETGGGGGYGPALERPPAEVARDVRERYVSAEGAARDYGVVVDAASLDVDAAATERLRRRLAAEPIGHVPPSASARREQTRAAEEERWRTGSWHPASPSSGERSGPGKATAFAPGTLARARRPGRCSAQPRPAR